jgi:hypothetical protein
MVGHPDGLLYIKGPRFQTARCKLSRKHSGERGRVLAGFGGVLALLGSFVLVVSILGGGSRALDTPVVQAQGDLDLTKDALGQHDGAREYRLTANLAPGFELEAGDDVTIVDDVDDDLIIVAIHDVATGWTCVEATDPSLGQIIECTLNDNSQLTQAQTAVVFYDACDTLERGSVQNTATIFLNGVEEDSDVSNPNVFECPPTATPTSTPTGTPVVSTPTATPTRAPETPVPPTTPVITPPTTGSGGLASHASSTSLLGLVVLITGAGVLGWARWLSNQR